MLMTAGSLSMGASFDVDQTIKTEEPPKKSFGGSSVFIYEGTRNYLPTEAVDVP